MSEKTETTFTCDFCEGFAAIDSVFEYPKDWVKAGFKLGDSFYKVHDFCSQEHMDAYYKPCMKKDK